MMLSLYVPPNRPALAAQPRLDLHLGLHWRRLHCQYIGTEVRIGCRALIPSDLIFSNQVFWP
jgi:hypothetical protein